MLYRFIGTYTGDETISCGGVTWHGREPADVTDPERLRRLKNHPEFEAVADEPAEDDGEKSPPKRRGRAKKAAG